MNLELVLAVVQSSVFFVGLIHQMMIQDIRNRLEQLKGQRTKVEHMISQDKQEIEDLKLKGIRQEHAREIIREVALKTQEKLQYNISAVTTLALESVFENAYELVAEFVQRRNKTECDLYFKRDVNKIDPLSASGGGAVDVAAFALRVASWSMENPKSRPVLLLDEPFKHLKGEVANLRVLEMIKSISKKLGIQIIMVSDERIPREDIIANADKVFETKIRKGITTVS